MNTSREIKATHQLRKEFWQQFEPIQNPEADARIELLASREQMAMAEAWFVAGYHARQLRAELVKAVRELLS